MLVSKNNIPHSYSRAIRSNLVGRPSRNRRKEKAKRRAKTSEAETAIAEAKTLLNLYRGDV
jgi:hypothetical protein